MKKVKPYSKYKSSGIEWLGDIPEHWEVQKLKYIANCFPSNVDKHSREGEAIVRLCNYTDVYKNDFITNGMRFMEATASDEQIRKFSLLKDDIIITKDSETSDDIAVPAIVIENLTNVICGYHLSVIRANLDVNPKYLFRLFQHKKFNSQFEISSNGVTRVGLGVYDLINATGIKPTSIEQIAIAKFLDYKLSKIERFIRKKKQLIKLLNEQKAAIINQTVTKGINPDEKMKPSGIDWLGDIPEHWEVRKLKYVGKLQNGISAGADYFGFGYPFISYGDIYKNYTLPKIGSGMANSSEQDRINYSVQAGDVFFTRTSETIEEIGFTSTCLETIENATFSGFIIRFRPFVNLLFPGFSTYYFRSTLHRRFFVREMNLVTRASLSQVLLKRMPVLLPPINEQTLISKHIETETSKLNQTIATIENEITLVQEYRTTLIAEAVTGKINVRGYEIPEVEEMESYEEIEEELDMVAEDAEDYQTEEVE